MMHIKNIINIPLFLSVLLVYGCGYKLGGLEVIGENAGKTASIKIESGSKSIKQTFVNSGFDVNDQDYEYIVKITGPDYIKETTSVTSDAVENEFTIEGVIRVSILDKDNNVIVENKVITFSQDHKFSSSNINSSLSEEEIIRDEIKKFLEVQAINILRSVI